MTMGRGTLRSETPVVLHDPRTLDPGEEIVRSAHLSDLELTDIRRVLDAMGAWREAERSMSEASQRYMKLGESDMRALRLLIAAQRQQRVITPSLIAQHLRISTASTTKLLDRLAQGGHIRRMPHPSDRRSLAIEVTDETLVAARQSVGRVHARRFDVVARLDTEQRRVVAEFFEAMAATAEEEN